MAIVRPAVITIIESEQIPFERETQAQREAELSNTGTKEQNATYDGAKAKTGGELNSFDSMETYTKKRAKPADFKPAEINIKKMKLGQYFGLTALRTLLMLQQRVCLFK